jgi:hypothetical protein
LANEWDMPRRSDACAACGHGFEIDEVFRAFLFETRAGYERRDCCLTCPPPDAGGPHSGPDRRPADENAAIGYWQTRRPAPAGKKVQPFDREAIYGFFRRLDDAAEPEKVQFRFVLALLLWRKRVLKFEGATRAAGREVWQYAAPAAGLTHHVERPDLDEEQLERLSGQLEQLLAGGSGDAEIVSTAPAAEMPQVAEMPQATESQMPRREDDGPANL